MFLASYKLIKERPTLRAVMLLHFLSILALKLCLSNAPGFRSQVTHHNVDAVSIHV